MSDRGATDIAVAWAEPPARPQRKKPGPSSQWVDAAADLKANLNRWAIVAVCAVKSTANGHASRIRTGVNTAFAPAGEFEATVRAELGDDVAFEVYARYVGPRELASHDQDAETAQEF